jgi:NAD(P)-dependent dehydrogenase (short-subunit alcohol dehydrogenase family)
MALDGQVVIVTGAARGIGRYAAHSFAKQGMKVALADIDGEALKNVARELEEMDVEALPIVTDVRDEAQVAAMVQQVVARFGRIDVLLNDAGIVPHFNWGVQRWAPIREMDKAFWDRVLETNLEGTFLCTKHVLPQMIKQGSGHVLGMHGGGGGVGAAAYVVSKDAIRTLMRFIADEEREHNICSLALSPGGAIATEEAPEEARSRLPAPDSLGDLFVQAAQAPMELSGKTVTIRDGRFETIGS